MFVRRSLLTVVVLLFSISPLLGGDGAAGPVPWPISFRNDRLRFEVAATGAARFIDVRTGRDHAISTKSIPFAQAVVGEDVIDVWYATPHERGFTLNCWPADVRVDINVHVETRYMVLEVAAIHGDGLKQLTFCNIHLAPAEPEADAFVGCALALNLQTKVSELPQANARLHVTCYERFGIVGSKVAIIGCPHDELRDIMKEVVAESPDIPQTRLGGPWAADAPINRGSYLMDVRAAVTEDTVDDWIVHCKRLGMTQIDFHAGRSMRFGDYEPAPDLFPNGRKSLKAVIDKLHSAGMKAGLHTYCFFVAKDTPWVTPVPDPGLAKSATFTLADDLDDKATTVTVSESTAGVSSDVGFHVRNSVTLQIDDELIVFKAARREAPFGFVECERGAHGTTPARHKSGAKVHRLKQCFNLFVPDGNSPMFDEVIQASADVYNECGFDMIYLDALDGADSLGNGWQDAWYWAATFTWELARRLHKPALFEMSMFNHHQWFLRSRMGAWDMCSRGYKPYVDMHTIVNEKCDRMFLPSHLGWWGVYPYDGKLKERMFPDDMEYILGKGIGNDSSLSLILGFSPAEYEQSAQTRRYAAMVKQYEELRLSNYFSDSVRNKLRERGKEFTLEQGPDDDWRFRRIHYDKSLPMQLVDGKAEHHATNRYGDQQPRIRVEVLHAVAPYTDPESETLIDFSSANAFEIYESNAAVTPRFATSTDGAKGGEFNGVFSAASTFDPPDGAWTSAVTRFEPTRNISGKALGLWVHGDGKGEVLNLQLRNPEHVSRGIRDHYVKVDFVGWRYVELVEAEVERIGEYDWPYYPRREDWDTPQYRNGLMRFAYPLYHFYLHDHKIESLSLWYNNIPTGETVSCQLSPIKALPLRSVSIGNPTITIGGDSITFPTSLASLQYLECRSMEDCQVFDQQGEVVANITPTGRWPTLTTGEHPVTFSCDQKDGPSPRVRVTIITTGEAIE